jgi:hypothetical protein
MAYRGEYKLGGKLFFAILLALVAGYIWACVENHRNPLDLLKIFAGKEPEAPPPKPAPPAPKPETKPAPAPVVKKEPKVEPAPVVKIEPTPTPNLGVYSAIEMSALFGTVDDLIRKGRFYGALEELRTKSRLKIPEEQVKTFADYEQRATKYHQLLQETTKGITVEMPPITRIFIKNAGKIVGKILAEDPASVILETLSNLRPKIMKSDIEKMETLQPIYGYIEITTALKDQCKYSGLVVEGEPGKPYTYKEQPGKSVPALRFFDLADFCARNGANDQVLPLFDEALKRDSNLLATVHEVKGEKMTNVFLFFLTQKAVADANKALELIKKNYADTKAYREKIATDAETKEFMDLVMSKKPAPQPMAKLDVRPPPVVQPGGKPLPSPFDTTKPENPPPTPVAPPPTPEPTTERSGDTYVSPTSIRLPEGMPPKVVEAVSKGDRYYDEAMKHLNLSNPTVSPTNWSDENHQALLLFKKANDEGYLPAQDMFGNGSIPQGLLDRVRDTTMCSAMCRKRSVSTKR